MNLIPIDQISIHKWFPFWVLFSGSWSSSSTGNNNRQSSTSLNIQGGSDSRNPSSSKIQIDISGGSNPPQDTECSRHAAQHDLNVNYGFIMNKFAVIFVQDLVPGEVNRPSGCSQCTRCNAEEPEIPGRSLRKIFNYLMSARNGVSQRKLLSKLTLIHRSRSDWENAITW